MNRTSIIALLSLLLCGAAAAQMKKAEKPVPPVPFSLSSQALVVTTDEWESAKGRAQRFSRRSLRSPWKAEGEQFDVVVGKNGMSWGRGLHLLPGGIGFAMMKTEGDGQSPAGIFSLTSTFGSVAKPAGVELPYTRLKDSTECVDDSESFHYNRIVDRFQVGIFDWKSSEKMLAVGAEYEYGVVVAHNSSPIVRGAGSCIFLHVWSDSETGTAGCTAMAKQDLTTVISWANPKRNPVLIQMPFSTYRHYQRSWKLPKL